MAIAFSRTYPTHVLVSPEATYKALLQDAAYPVEASIEQARVETNRIVDTRSAYSKGGRSGLGWGPGGGDVIREGGAHTGYSEYDGKLSQMPDEIEYTPAPVLSGAAEGIGAREHAYAQLRAALKFADATANRADNAASMQGFMRQSEDGSVVLTSAGNALHQRFAGIHDAFTARSLGQRAHAMRVSAMAKRDRANAVAFPQLGQRCHSEHFANVTRSAQQADDATLEFLDGVLIGLDSTSPHDASDLLIKAEAQLTVVAHARYSEGKHLQSIMRDPDGRAAHDAGTAYLIDPESTLSPLDGCLAQEITRVDGRLFDRNTAERESQSAMNLLARDLQKQIDAVPEHGVDRAHSIHQQLVQIEQMLDHAGGPWSAILHTS